MTGYKLPIGKFEDGSKYEDHKEIADWIWERSSSFITATNGHPPTLFFFKNGETNIVSLAMLKGDDFKEAIAMVMHDIARDPGVYALALIMEAWALKLAVDDPEIDQKTENAMKEGVEGNPDKIEVLSLSVEMRGRLGSYIRTAEIKRNEDESVFGLNKELSCHSTNNDGRFSNIFPAGQA